MPEPRNLGNVAKAVLDAVTAALEESQEEFFEVVLHAHAGEVDEVIAELKDLAGRNYVVLRAITFLLADKPKEAEDVLIQAKLKWNKER